MTENSDTRYSLMGGSHFINSIRDTGYKNTGYALGELIDNSIQAGASEIHIIAETQRVVVTKRTRETLIRISVIDNGCGMDPELLRSALLFGEGTNFNKKNSLGKYGVGLPQASLSQATMVKVWSWQNGPDHAFFTQIDIKDEEWVKNGALIPEPKMDPVPSPFCRYIDANSKSGTVVSWSYLDKISWRTASALYQNVESLIGRMYRYWISDNKVRIYYHTLNIDSGEEKIDEFRAVDPLFLMTNTSIVDDNPPVNPMFEEVDGINMEVVYGNVKSVVRIRGSVVRPEIRKLINKVDQAGSKPYGKTAAKNTGVSIVRENRELELISEWAASASTSKDPRNRWWGVEVSFNSELDELFGVTNDKQHANNLINMWNKTIDDFKLEGESVEDAKTRLEYEDPSTLMLLKIVETISQMISTVFKRVPAEKSTKSSTETKNECLIEKKVTENTEILKEKGQIGNSDLAERELSNEKKQKELVDTYRNYGVPEEEIAEITQGYITNHYKYHFARAYMVNEDAFFVPRYDAGAIVILLNTAHPMYHQLFEIFDFMDGNYKTPGKEIDEETYEVLSGVYESMKIILASWARLEDVAIHNKKRGATNYRNSWGRMVKQLNGDDLDYNDEDDL